MNNQQLSHTTSYKPETIAGILRLLHVDAYKIRRLNIIEAGTYNPVHHRPHVLDTSPETLNRLGEALSSSHGKITPSAVSTHMPTAIRPGMPGNQAAVANGWGERRYRFFLEVETRTMGSTHIHIYQGYSEYLDESISGKLDPAIPFVINAVTTFRRTTTPDGRVHDTVISDTGILSSNIDATNESFRRAETRTIRPVDVFNGEIVQQELPGQFANDYGVDLQANSIIDASSVLTSALESSSRSNGVSSKYMSKIINAYGVSKNQSELSYSSSDVFSNACTVVAEHPPSHDATLRLLGRVGTRMDFVSNRFTINTLIRIDPSVTSRINKSSKPSVPRRVPSVVSNNITNANTATTHSAGETEYWGNINNESSMAYMLGTAIPSIMGDLLLTKLAFTATNGTVETGPIFIPSAARSLLAVDLQAPVERFKDRFLYEVYNAVTMNNQVGVDITVNADLFNETWISISVNNAPEVTFVLPTFSDSTYSPVLVDSPKLHNEIIQDFNVFFQTADNVQ